MSFTLPFFRKKDAEPFKGSYQEPTIGKQLSERLIPYFAQHANLKDLVVVCVGTDRSTGDSLGPFVGMRLKRMNAQHLHVYGTIDEPVHAMNLQETMDRIAVRHQDAFILAVDACLGQVSSVGNIQLAEGPVKPGAGVNKDLPPVGDIHITGIVNVGGFMEYFVLQNTRLSLVLKMADIIADSVAEAAAAAYSPLNRISRLDG